MKNKITYLLLLISGLYFSLNHSYGQKTIKNVIANSNDSTIIIKLENDWTRALINRDEKTFENLLANDFFYTENDKMYSRAEVIAASMSVSDTIESAYNDEMAVHLKDKTAIVTGWLFVNGKSNSETFKRKYRFTDVWFNEKGVWQLGAAQDYLLP